MLDQILVPRPLDARGRREAGDRIPLMEPRKDQRRRRLHLTGDRVPPLTGLQVQKPADDRQPVVPSQHLSPQVSSRRLAPVRWWVACPAVQVASVERQEVRLGAIQSGGHPHFLIRDREMHQRPRPEPKQRLSSAGGRVLHRTVLLVLLDRVRDALGEVGLQLQRRHRKPVHEQHQVQRVVARRRVVDLPHHPQPHLAVPVDRGRVQRRLRLELRHREPRRDMRKALPQHIQRPATGLQRRVQPLHQPIQHLAAFLD